MKFDLIPIKKQSINDLDYQNVVFSVQTANVLDYGHYPELWFFLKTMIDGGAVKFILNMKNLDFLDSSGIGIIIKTAKIVRKLKGDVVLIQVPPGIDEIFKPIGFHRFMRIYTNQDEAVKYLQMI